MREQGNKRVGGKRYYEQRGNYREISVATLVVAEREVVGGPTKGLLELEKRISEVMRRIRPRGFD